MMLMEICFLGLSNVVTDKSIAGLMPTMERNHLLSLVLQIQLLIQFGSMRLILYGSGLYTRKWYVFTTKENEPPDFWVANSHPTVQSITL